MSILSVKGATWEKLATEPKSKHPGGHAGWHSNARHALGALLGGVALIGFQLLDQRSDQTTPVVTDILPTSTVAPAPPAP